MFTRNANFEISRRRLLQCGAGLGAGIVAGAGFSAAAQAVGPKLKAVNEGFMTIAMTGTMPLTGVMGGKITGSDAEMIVAIAERLGLGVKPNMMAWSATIESIKTGRADIVCGSMDWTVPRANAMLLTDAIYFSGNFITMKKEMPYKDSFDLNDAKGYSIGTGTGHAYVPDLKRILGTRELKLYDSVDACLRDVVAGRPDLAVMDSMNVDYVLLQNPNFDLKQIPLKPNTQYPSLSGRSQAVMGLSLDNPDLFDVVNEGVKWLWRTKENIKILDRNGMTSPSYLVKPETNPRIGIDRDEKGNILGPAAHTPKDFSSYFA